MDNNCRQCKHFEDPLKPDKELTPGQLTGINLVPTPRCRRGYTKKLNISGMTDCRSFKPREG